MDYIKVGKLNKSFGTKGHIRVVPEKAFKNDLLSADVWFVEKGGDMVPFFVDEIKDDTHLLVKFEDIDAPESAKTITGSIVRLRKKDVTYSENTEKEEGLDKLIGYEIWDNESLIGSIGSIEEYPQQTMALVNDDSDNIILIPLTPAFIIDISIDESKITMDLPDGLINTQKGNP